MKYELKLQELKTDLEKYISSIFGKIDDLRMDYKQCENCYKTEIEKIFDKHTVKTLSFIVKDGIITITSCEFLF
jgi:hypothetical protein